MGINNIIYCETKEKFNRIKSNVRDKGLIGLNLSLVDEEGIQWQEHKEKTVLIVHEETNTVELMSEDELREWRSGAVKSEELTGMDCLIDFVEQWSIDKELISVEPSKQFLKVTEEVGEVAAALARDNRGDLIDALGDTIVTLIILAQQCGLTIEGCLNEAYNVIKDRTGEMQDGVFVKDEDL